jgi:hypothetical protein
MSFLRCGVPGMLDTQGLFDDFRGLHRSSGNDRDDANRMHALYRAYLRSRVPSGRDQDERGWRRYVGLKAEVS